MTISDFVAQNRLEDAINLIKDPNERALLSNRLADLNRSERLGLLSFSEASLTRRQIVNSILNSSGATVNVNNFTNVNVNSVTLIFTSKESFKESLERIDLPTLVDLVTKEFTGKEAMKEWLPLYNEYNAFALLNQPVAPGYFSNLKTKLVDIYEKYYVAASEKKDNKIKSAIMAVYNSLLKDKSEHTIRECITDLQIFFYENPGFVGINQMDEYEKYLDSDKMNLFRTKRPDSFNEELETIHSDLVQISNRIILNLEK